MIRTRQQLAQQRHIGQSALMSPSALIVTSGVPGTGKSTLAIALALELHAVVLSKDVIEAALWRRGISREKDSFWVSHEILTTLADDALRRDQHVVIDTVATTEDVRRDWRDLARRARCPFVVVLCVCSDIALHRSRLVGRIRGIPGWPELQWGDVERVSGRFEPWSDDHLVVDAVADADDNLHRAIAFVNNAIVAAN